MLISVLQKAQKGTFNHLHSQPLHVCYVTCVSTYKQASIAKVQIRRRYCQQIHQEIISLGLWGTWRARRIGTMARQKQGESQPK